MGSQRSYHNIVTYQPFFIQKDKGEEVGYDYCYIYKFFAYSKLYNSYFKYIIRAEAYKDCFAIKFYCARQKHSEEKYSKILNAFNARETFQIFYCVALIIPQLLILHPGSSFCFMGARTLDKKGKIENKENNQRYRVYSEISRNLFGKNIFELRMSDNLSSGFFINKLSNKNIEEAEKHLVNYFYNIFNFEI